MITIGEPHFSHFSSVAMPARFTSVISFLARTRSTLNLTEKSFMAVVPLQLALFDLVELLLEPRRVGLVDDVAERLLEKRVTSMPSCVGKNFPSCL